MRSKFYSVFGVILILVALHQTASGKETNVSGWRVGAVPALSYNSDTGFQYGIIVNLYNYGDGSIYPDYLYSLYTEWSRTTKGSGINKLFFDSKYLLPWDVRITSELSYLTEQALPFYGFNGYEAWNAYNSAWEDKTSSDYITRVFYRHDRRVTRLLANFQRHFLVKPLRWIAGFGYWSTEVGTVDLKSLNKGKSKDEALPDTSGLYREYIDDGYIPPNEADGGMTNYLRLGLVYDTRDNEANPMKGIWTEALLTMVPEFLGSDFSYTQLTVTHRQYFTIIPRDLSFAYRVGYQGVISGHIPFFMLPFYHSSYKTEEGLGGSKTLRGILKNRVVGKSEAFANLEFRWKFYRTVIMGQNIYLALNTFLDGGEVLEEYGNQSYLSAADQQKPNTEEHLHLSYGAGLRIALNENFIVAADYGIAADPQDGNSGFYITLGYLF